jgi:hypothetical protein
MPHQVDGVLVHAMSGNELSRVRTEFRLRPPEPINQCLLESRGPTLLCNHVVLDRPSSAVSSLVRRFQGSPRSFGSRPSAKNWPSLVILKSSFRR